DRLEDVADAARRQVRARWRELADLAKRYFLEQAERRSVSMTAAQRRAFDQTWERQHENVLVTSWSAAAWPELEPIEAWRARHATWIPNDALERYAAARRVYAATNDDLHCSERGFDYPLIHHALHVRHGLRKA